jgi:tripartite-type tricarboxylate transporter receptor subunit TctC
MVGISRRAWLRGGAACAAGVLGPRALWAQAYPQRPVRVIVPYAPGGGTDVFSRLLATQMERELGQPLVIDNRAGGGSTIGTQTVAKADPDGHTIGMVDSAFVTNPGLFKDKLPYDTRKDFIPVSLLSRTQLVLSVHPSSPFKTGQELVAFAKANPGKLTFASAGIGTGIHLAAEQFRQVAGIEIVIVPYRGGAPALADFISGKVDFTFGAVPSIREYILTGRARGLGVTRGRSPQLPDIPSMEEIGYPGVDSASEMGLIVPASTPAAVVERLQRVAANAVKDATFGQNLQERGFQPIGSTSEEFRVHVDREIDKWIRIIATGNIKPE